MKHAATERHFTDRDYPSHSVELFIYSKQFLKFVLLFLRSSGGGGGGGE